MNKYIPTIVIVLACFLCSCANQTTVGNNNTSSITIFGGGGGSGPRMSSRPVGSRVDIMSRECHQEGGRQMGSSRMGGSGRVQLGVTCDRCHKRFPNGTNPRGHECLGNQGGPRGPRQGHRGDGFTHTSGSHTGSTRLGTSPSGPVLRSSYYGPPGTVVTDPRDR